MKIEIKETGSREFYDELIFTAAQRRRIAKGKTPRIQGMTGYLRNLVLLGVFGTVFTGISYLVFADSIFVAMCGMMAAFTTFLYMNYRSAKKSVTSMMDVSGTRTIELDGKGVKFTDQAKTLNFRWEDVLKVVFGDHSIAIIPKEEREYVIALESKYRDEIMDVLKENGLTDKAVGNI